MIRFIKANFIYLLVGALLFVYAFSKGGERLPAKDFAQKIKEIPAAQIIDVRTPEEFNGGYIPGAVNIDWNGDQFEAKALKLNKYKPVFVYCLSGGRSSSAVRKLKSMGFEQLYELEGGIMSWRAYKLPEMTSKVKPAGMSLEDYDRLLRDKRLVLVDFYAPWCAPCKKMAPYLNEIAQSLSASIKIARINADDHPGLSDQLQVSGLPTLILYKDSKKVWSHTGYISKSNLMGVIKGYL